MATMKSFMLDETQLEELIEFAGPNGEMAHRFIYHVLCQLRTMGYQHRDDWKIILTNGEYL